MSSYVIYEYDKDPGIVDIHSSSTTNSTNSVDDDDDRSQQKQQQSRKEFHIRVNESSGGDMNHPNSKIVQVVMERQTSSSKINERKYHNDSQQLWQQPQYFGQITVRSIQTILLTFFQSVRHIVLRLVLPVGYPTSVRTGYISYQIYDSIQGLCSYLRNVLCAASILEAAGVGDETATAWTAAISWAIRDGTGLIGSLVYTYFVSDHLDAHVKEFRLFADIINDVGFTLDMIAPFFGRHSIYYWYISSSSVLCKTMCGISAGATKGSITQHFAIRGNMADLNAKESTQETIVTLMGMVGGIYAAKYLQQYEQTHSDSRVATWVLFLVLTIIHVWANYQGVSLLRLRTINRSRIDQCLKGFYGTVVPKLLIEVSTSTSTNKSMLSDLAQKQQIECTNTLLSSVILSPLQIQEIMYESIWQMIGILPKSRIVLDVSLTALQHDFHNSLIGQVLKQVHSTSSTSVSTIIEPSTLLPTFRYNVTIMESKTKKYMVGVTLLTGATSYDELQAYVHAKCIEALMEQHFVRGTKEEWIHYSHDIIKQLFSASTDNRKDEPLLISELRKIDWDVDNGRFYLGFSQRRSQWKTNSYSLKETDDADETTGTKKDN
jgi:Vitamin B6 photo-protection and homoeostasis